MVEKMEKDGQGIQINFNFDVTKFYNDENISIKSFTDSCVDETDKNKENILEKLKNENNNKNSKNK